MDAQANARSTSSSATTRSCAGSCPTGADIFDAHLHLGHDIDGMVGDYDQLEALMAAYGISRAFMFCLDEPDRQPSFTAANDRTLAFAERSRGRLIPFVRLDLNESPIEEARRALDLGARGIKLHPRAQKFTATDERLGPVFELASERRVPILIHGGRGLPPIADGPARPRRPLPGRDADHRALRDRRPRRARALHGGSQGRALRHLDVEPDRPPRLLPADPSRAGRLRERLPVRPADRRRS